jgi:hypothetical protein
MVAALGIFTVVTTDVLGIIKRDGSGGWQFSLPTINQCIPETGACVGGGGTNCCSGFECLDNAGDIVIVGPGTCTKP